MRCTSCGAENPAGAKFCIECAAPFARRCPSCGSENPPRAKFCAECATPLTAEVPRPKSQVQSLEESKGQKGREARVRSPESRQDVAERRQLTVMFCDLVGSTPLAEQLDPEELREVVRAYQESCTAVIHRFDGYIARYVGDALLVYFGYPQAHEDDAQRAVRAGLDIVAALPALNQQVQRIIRVQQAPPLQVRIGIHTGLVVVGELGGQDYREAMALGETPNLAARLQGIAAPDTVVISAATQRLIAGLFTCQDLGLQELKGISTPVPAYCVLSESGMHSRFEAAVRKGLTPLVGREEELGLLRRRWEQAKAGEGQVVLLSGEAGIGKSRLVQALKEQVLSEGATRVEFRCSAYHQNSAFYPIVEHLQRLLQFVPHEAPHVRLTKLNQMLARYRFPQADTLPLLAALLSLPQPDSAPPLTLSPQKQKQKTQDALVAWLVEEAAHAAVYCVWEDLHWADPSTLELLTLLLDQVPTTRQLALLTFRPDFTPPWRPRSHMTHLTLTRLGRQHIETMVEKATGGKALPGEVLQQIVTKTDGVPLFVEELTKMVLESGLLREEDSRYVGAHGGAPIPPLAIPATLQDSLMARLDRLSAVREIAQLGATLGREFSYELLHAVSPLYEGSLQQGLRQLVEAELVYQRGVPPQATYIFKHALIQDAAYQSLLKSTRQRYHRQIAQALEERFAEIKETQPELLAHHYTEAGLIEQALPYWLKAGERASQRSAYVEAISHLARGLEVLKPLPDTPERVQHELALQAALGTTLMITKGYAAPEVERAYARALALCQQLGETPQLVPVLFRLWLVYLNQGELQTARALAEQLLSLAQRAPTLARLLAHQALGLTLFYLGEFMSALTHIEQSIVLYDPQLHRPDRSQFSTTDRKVSCLCFATDVLWMLGYPDQARQRINEALAVARELSHPFSLAFALNLAANLNQSLRKVQAVQARTEALLTLAREHGFPFFLALGAIRQGWVLAEQGQAEEGIAQIRQGLAAYRATGAEVLRPNWLALLAEAYGIVGQTEEGLNALTEALKLVQKTGGRNWEAELYRLKGELTLQKSPKSEVQSPKSEADECFLKAIEIARQQQAKSLELRAVMSLSRLWQQQGKKAEARQMLAEIYGWFTEGFDTKDLQEAKALLEELV
jgi:class 3 adenylate cyclase/predicted ATPase